MAARTRGKARSFRCCADCRSGRRGSIAVHFGPGNFGAAVGSPGASQR